MPMTAFVDGFLELRQWADPVVYDRLSAAYRDRLADDALAHGLARAHARVWRALIARDAEALEASRPALLEAVSDAGLPSGCLAGVDAEVLDELEDVVAARYGRSQRAAAVYRLAFAELSRSLRRPPARVAA